MRAGEAPSSRNVAPRAATRSRVVASPPHRTAQFTRARSRRRAMRASVPAPRPSVSVVPDGLLAPRRAFVADALGLTTQPRGLLKRCAVGLDQPGERPLLLAHQPL